MKYLSKAFRVIILLLLMVLVTSTPIHAIGNPTSISFGYYDAFYNVLETGDLLVVAEGKINYAATPTDYTADQAYIFELLDVTGTVIIAATPLQDYGESPNGDRPIGMYFTHAQFDTLGLVLNTAYIIRITGNPLIFPSQTGNTVTASLAASNYKDQLLGVDGGIPTNNEIRNTMIQIAMSMQITDTPVDDYWESSEGYKYLATAGSDLFLAGIPGLAGMCPILFKVSVSPISGDTPESKGTYAQTLTVAQKWGTTVSSGLTNLGLYLGMSQALAGSVVLFTLVIALAIFIYSKTESGIVVLLMVAITPFIGAYLGLMPLALAFVFVIFIIVLLGYFFLSRGAL